MKGKRIYLSGPMTGIEECNRPAFNLKAVELRKQGAIVLNPARHPLGLDYEEYMRLAILDVELCDIVVCLPGWENSPGAIREIRKAKQLGKMVITGDMGYDMG